MKSKLKSKLKKTSSLSDQIEDDVNALPYDFKNKRISTEAVKAYNEKGFGAGGLPPLTFSHLKRNWCNLPTWDNEEDGMEQDFEDDGIETSGMDWSYGPGMGFVTQQDTTDITSGKQEITPSQKRVCVDPKPRPQAQVIQIPSHQIQRYSGGRGRKRIRTKKVVEGIYK